MIRDGIYRKAGASETAGCVEVAADDNGIHVRDSKRREQGNITVTDGAWAAFIADIRAGKLGV